MPQKMPATAGRRRKAADQMAIYLDKVDADGKPIDVDAEYAKIISEMNAGSEWTDEDLRRISDGFSPEMLHMMNVKAIDGRLNVAVSRDEMRVCIDIEPPLLGGGSITEDQVRQALNERGIVYGVDISRIRAAVEQGKTNKVTDFPVAKAIPPQTGEDGRVELMEGVAADDPKEAVKQPADKFGAHIPTAALMTVEPGDSIARIVPPADGRPGKTVFGADIRPTPGRPCAIEAGKGVSIGNDGIFRADVSGRVEVNEAEISVENMLNISGDLDIATGHIKFAGEVLVNGYVKSGLSIMAECDVVIKGGAEPSRIVSEFGSVFVKKGVQGAGRGMIQARFDFSAKFVENATVLAKGNIEIEQALNCTLVAAESILANNEGVVRGGRVYAGKIAEFWDLGSECEIPTEVKLGIDPDDFMRLQKIRTKLAEAQEILARAKAMLAEFGAGVSSRKPASEKDQEDSAPNQDSLRRIKALTNRALILSARCREIEKEEERLSGAIAFNRSGIINVYGRVYPGVTIEIGGAEYRVERPISQVSFSWDKMNQCVGLSGL